MQISSQFDAGNINVLSMSSPEDIQLEIKKDNQSDFYQWFYFRISGISQKNCRLKIGNAGKSAYPDGWKDYQAVGSYDRKEWFRVPTSFDGETLEIQVETSKDAMYLAYFAPYSMERHQDLISRMGGVETMSLHTLGKTLDGRDLDMVQVGTPGADKKSLWVIGRQHPGESMAEWWMEGFLEKLADASDPVTNALLKKSVIYVVPNMNPDGSFRGHLRTNAMGKNLNREWNITTPETSPEVYWVIEKMKATGVDFNLDVHGDEALPYNFIAGSEGIPSWSPQRQNLLDTFKRCLQEQTPDFQTQHGYPVDAPGEANLAMCTNYVAETFNCLAMTLEMPFKDTVETPCERWGWSPERSKKLGHSCLETMLKVWPEL